jgi:hypothetical protein
MIETRVIADLRYGSEPARDFDELISLVPDSEITSPVCSTVVNLGYWKKMTDRLFEIVTRLGFKQERGFSATFEYLLSPQRGKGNPSHTDLMLMAPATRIAIEAKFTESRYETVAKWLGKGNAGNRQLVLSGWTRLLEIESSESILHLPYQLIHRAASSCAGKETYRAMVYLQFVDDQQKSAKLASVIDDMKSMRRLVSSQKLNFLSVIMIPVSLTDACHSLQRRWTNPHERIELPDEIREAIRSNNLYVYGEPRVVLLV